VTLREIGAGNAENGGVGGASLFVTRLLLALVVLWFAASSAVSLLSVMREFRERAEVDS
jgi:preprotein translocase subunit SecG